MVQPQTYGMGEEKQDKRQLTCSAQQPWGTPPSCEHHPVWSSRSPCHLHHQSVKENEQTGDMMPPHQILDTLLLTLSLIRHLITDKTNCWPQHTWEVIELSAVTMNILVIITKSCFSPFTQMKSAPAFLHFKIKSLVYCLSQHQRFRCYPSLKSITKKTLRL